MELMTEQRVRVLIAGGETPTAEFKSDRGPLSDTNLIETVVCLANGQGAPPTMNGRKMPAKLVQTRNNRV